MLKKSILQTLGEGIVYLHGISGGGKSVVVEKFKEASGVTTIFSAASGDFFRTMVNKDQNHLPDEVKEVAQMLKDGKYIPSLKGIMPPLEDMFEEYFFEVLNGRKALLLMDGFLRQGKFEYEGRIIPSQVDQIGEAASRGLTRAFLSLDYTRMRELVRTDRSFAFLIANHKEEDYERICPKREVGGFAHELVINAKHVVINIPPGDGEALMRIRYAKALSEVRQDLFKQIREKSLSNGEEFQSIFGRVQNLLEGKFCIAQGKVVLIEHEKLSLRHFTPEECRLIDRELQKETSRLYDLVSVSGERPDKFTSALKSYCSAFNLEGIRFSMLRNDDERGSSREERVANYQNRAVPQIINNELKLGILGHRVLLDGRKNIFFIENGPSLGITYNSLQDRAARITQEITNSLPTIACEKEFSFRKEALI